MFATESLQQEFVTSNICTYNKSGLTLANTIELKTITSKRNMVCLKNNKS